MDKKNLPNGFISVDEAIALIQSDSRTNATVNVAFLVKNLPWIEKNHNFTIKLLRHEGGKVVDNGIKYVAIESDYQKEILKHAIVEHYKEMSGREFDPETVGVRKITTAVEDDNPQGRPKVNKTSQTNIGDTIISEERISEE